MLRANDAAIELWRAPSRPELVASGLDLDGITTLRSLVDGLRRT